MVVIHPVQYVPAAQRPCVSLRVEHTQGNAYPWAGAGGEWLLRGELSETLHAHTAHRSDHNLVASPTPPTRPSRSDPRW